MTRTWRHLAIIIALAALNLTALPTANAQVIIDTLPPREFPLAGKLIPQHIGGDRNFAGHGPAVTAQVFLDGAFAGSRTLSIQVCMDAIETRTDFTHARGCGPREQIYQANTGFCIQTAGGLTVETLKYTDTDTTDDTFGLQSLLSNVDRWTITGDTTSSSDAGSRTGLRILTRPIAVTTTPC